MAKYSKKAQQKVAKAMREMKEGKLRSSSGDKVTNPKQAIAIGLSEAREAGAKVPPPKTGKSKAGESAAAGKRTARKTAAKKAAPKKTATKKAARRRSS